MKKILYVLALSATLYSCKTSKTGIVEEQPIITTLDLINVKDDKVMVSIDPAAFTIESTTFYIPKTVPGTYSTSNFGKYSEDLKAYDYKGNELKVVQVDENSWTIPNAKKLDKITYWVNDTFDIPGEGGIYSMAGTNILEDENFLLNLHGFVGYFKDMKEEKYRLEIKRPADLIAGTALNISQSIPAEDGNFITDVYQLNRYFEVTDNPIMYATPDTVSFKVGEMEVLLDVYSPNKVFSAEDIKPAMQKMVSAQKRFLGDIDDTNKYAILLYLSPTPGDGDAGNFGALEHHTSTVVVLPEGMGPNELEESLIDIVSHEFFHIVTPLGVHSEEIHYFDYNDPKMSKHLWMYEGVTEYFANLFQVNQGLINQQDFYDRINDKINTARNFDDTMPFTLMSENILEEKYESNYYNVYQKGALIGMALDIRLRELSEGRMGILDLMKKLTDKYGKNRPFKDDQLIDEIVKLTYPEIREFFDTYVSGPTPIPYHEFLEKVGLQFKEDQVKTGYFLKDNQTPYITINQSGNISMRNDIDFNSFHNALNLQAGDMIKSINGTRYTRENIYDLITTSMQWKTGEEINMLVIRNGDEIELQGKIVEPTAPGMRIVEILNASDVQIELRNAWMKS
ncbi:M61 family metallopeptidase [Salinimicrobium gaetbulicola]|uniref:Peptidase M61 n=1 Tax=Salinimicrobium gaetbulicola TaxID=999702 RepID=A0ABW3ICU1_9FLAO